MGLNSESEAALHTVATGIFTSISLYLLEIGRDMGRAELTRLEIKDMMEQNPLAYNYYFNSGDFSDCFTISVAAGVFLDSKFPNMSEKIKGGLSSAAGAGVTLIAETTGVFNQHASIEDIPAGIAGALLYLGVRHLVRRRFIDRQLLPISQV